MNAMKVSFVTSSVSRDAGGLFFAMTSLARSLDALGLGIDVHGVNDSNTREDAAKWAPVPVFAHPIRGPKALAYAPELSHALAASDRDLLHTHGLWQWPSAAGNKR